VLLYAFCHYLILSSSLNMFEPVKCCDSVLFQLNTNDVSYSLFYNSIFSPNCSLKFVHLCVPLYFCDFINCFEVFFTYDTIIIFINDTNNNVFMMVANNASPPTKINCTIGHIKVSCWGSCVPTGVIFTTCE